MALNADRVALEPRGHSLIREGAQELQNKFAQGWQKIVQAICRWPEPPYHDRDSQNIKISKRWTKSREHNRDSGQPA
jgi:hypothetical protein